MVGMQDTVKSESETPKTCYKCEKETRYLVMAVGGTFVIDTQRRVCERHLLQGALDSYKIGLKKFTPRSWVKVYRDMSSKGTYEIDSGHPHSTMAYLIEMPVLTERANAIVRQYRIKHGTYQTNIQKDTKNWNEI